MSIKELLKKIDIERIPKHVAIIMDGNGRWAKRHNLPRIAGHREGAKRVRKIVEVSKNLGIKVLTLYAFSTENWLRPKKEIKALMHLLVIFLRKELKSLKRDNVKLTYCGNIKEFPKAIREEIIKTAKATIDNTALILNLALNYGGRDEIIRAINNILNEHGKKTDITPEIFSRYLYTADLPDPDLLIRTSGEKRISNFLLWQIAYTELYFTPVLWPDFKENDFLEAILDYQNRERRFGSV